jgi:Family of unknown function (DUF6286)
MSASQWVTRGLAAVVALALLVASVVAVVKVAAAAAGREAVLLDHEAWTAWLSEQSWSDPVVRAILAGMVLVGLLLVVLALRRGRPASLPLRDRTPGVSVRASRRSVERSLVAAASRTSGIIGADASVRRRSARVEARAFARPDTALREQVEAAVKGRLGSLGLAREPRLRVQVDAKERR